MTKRSDTTKARILAAAQAVFAEVGYDRATIRRIAEEAHIHPSMVMRYFESKEGLFTASSPFNLQLPELSAVPRECRGEFIVTTLLDRWGKRRGAADLPALLRLSMTHPDGREKAIAVFTEQVRPMLAQVISGNNADEFVALVATTLVGIAFLRYVLELPPVVALSDEFLVRHAGRIVQDLIDRAGRQ